MGEGVEHPALGPQPVERARDDAAATAELVVEAATARFERDRLRLVDDAVTAPPHADGHDEIADNIAIQLFEELAIFEWAVDRCYTSDDRVRRRISSSSAWSPRPPSIG